MPGPLLYTRVGDSLLFKPSTTSQSEAVLSISHHDSGVTLVDPSNFPKDGETRKIAGLIGILHLRNSRVVLTADRVEVVGNLGAHSLFKVTAHSLVLVNTSIRPSAEDNQYLALLRDHLAKATLYYSYTYDLTHSVQRNEGLGPASWRTADTRFFWNYYATEPLRNLAEENALANEFVLPLIYGYVKVVDTVLQSTPVSVGLITRRSRFRAGTRYFRRGADADGNVANFNETEQVLLVPQRDSGRTHWISFLQTRGSVPVYWAEVNNLKYKPDLMLSDTGSLDACAKHFSEQKKLYGDNYLVNLVNQKGYELPVKESYESSVATLNDPHLHYVYFDFHHECRKMQWHRINVLVEQLRQMGLDSMDVFHKVTSAEGDTETVVSKQKSVVRTNCMDCLDRTNVVQSVLAGWVLQQQLENASVLPAGVSWKEDSTLLNEFQNFWADNADAISKAYSGTGALKTDFTRTGKRTYMGAFQDFVNSVSRYYQNNCTDGPRQDSYDLFLGNFRPYHTSVPSPFIDKRPLFIQLLPTIIYAALTVIAATVFFPKGHFLNRKNLQFFIGSSLVALFALRVIFINGMQYVNWPKLTDLGFVVAVQTHNKEQVFKGIQYRPSSHFVKPPLLKRD
ncbi:AER447Cp [Eremothecium gossypii ATCC 10895]|uniref:AER447Cp n=1 Tax=Eremothecium gossypii (strain ATCC 10895 / CBS 109.51 / FGSC 9923 / NRRL Y-1056) TaxID=284811 RepID=Q755S1_EREGS|nr:AER447Cp [Eremothecium gossypii ATCC 10895]AAS53126.1 AER447Cp [Eremothecium gossypii ATCC 10895]AEY97435.1 FAER447Cp [Eremothecium gossypii FDAG1]